MNLRQMVARVMRAVPALPPGRLGEDDVIDMLNQAQEHLSRVSSKVKQYDFELDEGYGIVPFPADMKTVSNVYWKSDAYNVELEPGVDRLALDQAEDEPGTPSVYYVQGSRVVLRPIPDNDGTVTISYIPIPTTMSEDTDVPDLEGSENYLIAFALHRIHLEAGSALMQLWDMEKAREEYVYLQTTDQNYRTPFQTEIRW